MGYTRVTLSAKDAEDRVTTLTPSSFKLVSAGGAVAGIFQSGPDGTANILLPVDTYEVRAFHFGADFGPPKLISLIEEAVDAAGPPVNTYYLYGARFKSTDSLDPAVCMAHGYFRTAGGYPAKGLSIQFTAHFTPLLVDGAAMVPNKVLVQTNDKGWAMVPLLRGGIYHAVVEGAEDTVRTVYVPDARSWSLPDILYPRVDRLVATPAGQSITLRVGQELSFVAELYATDGRKLPNLTDDAAWKVSGAAAALDMRTGGFSLRGLGVGVSTISVERTSNSVPSLPHAPVGNTPITVTVTA